MLDMRGMWLFSFPRFSLKKQLYLCSCIRTKSQYGLFLPHQETLLSLLPHASLSPSVYSLFCLCSHTRGFRSNHGISMVGPQTAGSSMFLTSCPCVRCLFSFLAMLKRWSHDVRAHLTAHTVELKVRWPVLWRIAAQIMKTYQHKSNTDE